MFQSFTRATILIIETRAEVSAYEAVPRSGKHSASRLMLNVLAEATDET